MKNHEPINITHKTEINRIGHSLVLARRALLNDNPEMHLSTLQLLRLVLLGCLCIEVAQIKYTDSRHKSLNDSKSLGSAIDYLSLNNDNGWIRKALHLSEAEVAAFNFDSAFNFLKDNLANPMFGDLLPYALELLEYSEQDLASASMDRRYGVVTQKKKKNGIYYTPVDVAAYMVETCVEHLSKKHLPLSECCFADFCCGSGIFLIQIIESVSKRICFNTASEYISFINRSLYGFDISEHAVDCARYSVAAYCMKRYWNQNMNIESLFRALHKNIVSADATSLNDFFDLHPSHPNRFECIVGNPPYVGITKQAEDDSSTILRSNLFIPFVENLIGYSSDNSVCSLVLPLSFSYNNQLSFRNMREKIEVDDAEWYVEHYDRSPDSLFGDDVKSRNCIVFRNSGNKGHKIYTTGLMRWTSTVRKEFLLSSKPLTDITELPIREYVPKLGAQIERQAFSKIVAEKTSLLMHLENCERWKEYKVVIKGTAYNWICAYDHIPPSYDESGNEYVSKELKVFSAKGEEDVCFAIAILNSTIAFWMWTVVGDGFHITRRMLESLRIDRGCFNPEQYAEVVCLGREFSRRIRQHPIQSVNSGKVITTYDHLPLQDIVIRIDLLMTKALGLPGSFPNYLHEWYDNIVSCGRPSRKRVSVKQNGGTYDAETNTRD